MKKIIFLLFAILPLASCNKWLDVNHDPNNPQTPRIDQLLPGIYYDMGDDLGIGYDRLGYVCADYVHQLVSRESIDQYGVTGASYAIKTYWQDLYDGPMQDIDLLIKIGEDNDNLVYAGIGKIIKAYLFSQMVDVWGDIPYSQANTPDNFSPVFDKDKDIYTSIFALIDDGISDLNNTDATNEILPGTDDLIYNGDVGKWIKAANSIKLKLYNQVRLTSMYNAAAVDTLISNDANLIGPGEDFLIPFGPSRAPDNRNPAFVAEYSGSQISNYISPWFYEILNGENANILQGIVDPRVPYYIVNQLDASKSPENPVEYQNGYFVSIYFGSSGPYRDAAGRATFSMMGLYPCGGAYDLDPNLNRSSSSGLGIDAGNGAAPYRMLTYADILYIKAELAKVGKISDDPRSLLEQAMYASFEQVDMVTKMDGATDVAPALSGSGADTTYVNAVLSQYDAATSAKQMELIMTEKWISQFGSAIDAYTDYRRTGYPVMFDPNTMASVANGGPDGNGPVPVHSNRGYPVSFPWSDDELTLNRNAPAQKVITKAKIFWDAN